MAADKKPEKQEKAEKVEVTPVAVEPEAKCSHDRPVGKCVECSRPCACGHTFGDHFLINTRPCSECMCSAFREVPR